MKEQHGLTNHEYIYVGSYNSKDQAGIHIYDFDKKSGELHEIGGVSGIENPSFLTFDQHKEFLYAVSEVEKGQVFSYHIEKSSGNLTYLNQQPTQGSMPCFVSVDPSNQWLFTVNYMGGSIGMFTIKENGEIGVQADHLHFLGQSVHPHRQEAPHPHSINPFPFLEGVFVCDLGTDQLHIFKRDESTHTFEEVLTLKAKEGSGPRHVAFHPGKPLIYVVEELSSSISVYHFDSEVMELVKLQTISTLPNSFTSANTTAEIKIDSNGKFLYASNRGQDSIACFKLLRDGKLQKLDHVSTHGKTPRHFNFIPDSPYMLVANQDSDQITIFKRNRSGIPVFIGKSIDVKAPVCIQPVKFHNKHD